MARLIEYEGRQIEVPDDATDEFVRSVLSRPPTASITVNPAAPPSPVGASPAADQGLRDAPAPVPGFNRRLQIGTQAAGAGLADIAGFPVDITTGALNLGAAGINKASEAVGLPTNIPPIQKPFMGSEFIRDTASKGAEAVGYPVHDPKTMTGNEKLGYDISRFGTQAVTAAGPMAARGIVRGAELVANKTAKLGDAFVRPYARNAGSTFAGDAAAGAGAGVGSNMFENSSIPKDQWYSPLAEAGSVMAGGLGGAFTKEIATAGKNAAVGVGQGVKDAFVSPSKFVDPETLRPYKRSELDTAATRVQDMASNPATAGRAIEENAQYYKDRGLPVPTSGLISEDVGMQSAEAAARSKDRVPFIERDNQLREAATDQVQSLRDPKADQGAVTARAKAYPGELAEARDATALPVLKRAEETPGPVDARPVANLIDEKLTTAKREPVRNALEKAKSMLNKPDSDEMDTTVAGLYESRKAINDIIEGRTENATGRFAKKELIEVRNELDTRIAAVSKDFPEYLDKFREGSKPLNALDESKVSQQLIAGEDPRDVAKRVFGSSRYGTDKEIDDITAIVSKDPAAARGWKAAVSEHMADKVTGLTKIEGDTFRVELASLDRLFKSERGKLAKVYSPEEMNKLQQAHKLLEPLKNANIQATAGSNTVDKMNAVINAMEAPVRLVYGALEGGSIVKRLRVLAGSLPNNRASVDRLVGQIAFDPEVATFLLTRDVSKAKGPSFNKALRDSIAVGAAARDEE
jgi:hypothetical protein